MDDALIETEDLSLHRKSLLPGTGFFYPDSLEEERREERVREAVEGAEAVVITDSDADGLACVALVREVYDAALDPAPFEEELAARLTDEDRGDSEAADEEPAQESPVALVPASPRTLEDALERVAAELEDGQDVVIGDLCPDSYGPIADSVESLVDRAGSVRWYDHHQWDEDLLASLRDAGVTVEVGDSEAECAADVVYRSMDHAFPERFATLVAVTRDHDLWLKEDPRSDDLADFAAWSSAEAYAALVGAYGVDLPGAVEEYLAQRRVEKENLIEAAVARADTYHVGDWRVDVTYGRCSQNEVAEQLRQAGADAAVIVKPAGSASIRGSDGFERAHEVAGRVNGGGHPKAAGCKPDIYDDMLDMARHWTSEGQAAKTVILRAFEDVAADASADEQDADDP